MEELRRRVSAIETAATERRQAEATLRESEERFRKVFEEGRLGILLVGTDGRIQHTNRHFCDMLGYSENEIIALGLPGILTPTTGRGITASSHSFGVAKSRTTTQKNAIFAKMAKWYGLN